MPPKGAKGKKGSNAAPPQAKKAKVAPPPAEDSDEDSDDSEDEEEEEPVRKVPQQKANKGKAAPPPEDSDEEDDSDDEVAAAAVDDDDDDDDDDDEDNDDDESDEEAKVPPKAKKVAAPAKDDDDDDDDDDEDEDDDEDDEEDSDDDDDDDGQAVNGKRKKEKQQDKPSKKQKVDDDSVCIFIGNLPKEMDEDKLKKLLKKNGVSAKEIRKPAKKRFAHVDLENEEDLPAALKLNGKQIGDTTLKVEQAKTKLDASFETPKKPDEARKSFGGKDDATLFVKNLAEDTTEESLKEFFPGSVEIRMPRKPDDSHKGFAYVVFKDKSDVDEALSDKQGSELDGNALFLDRAGSKPQTPGGGDKRKSVGEAGKTKVLFVKNLSFDTDEHALKKAFEGASSARIAKFQDTGKHRGFGFVEFDSAEDAQEAYNSMKGKEIDGRQIFVDFAGERGAGGGGGGGDRRGGGRGGFGGGGRGGGFRGGRGGGGRGGGFRGGRGGGGRGGQGGFRGKKTKFDD